MDLVAAATGSEICYKWLCLSTTISTNSTRHRNPNKRMTFYSEIYFLLLLLCSTLDRQYSCWDAHLVSGLNRLHSAFLKPHALKLKPNSFWQFCIPLLVVTGSKTAFVWIVSIYMSPCSLTPQTYSQKRPSVRLCVHPQGWGVEVERVENYSEEVTLRAPVLPFRGR